jgi:hypothetical protein
MTERQIELIYAAVTNASQALPAEHYKQLIDGTTRWCLEYICGHDFLMVINVLSKKTSDIATVDATEKEFTSQIEFIYEAAANGVCSLPLEYIKLFMNGITAWCIETLATEEWKKRVILTSHKQWNALT